MFNNFINTRDFIDVLCKGPAALAKLANHLTKSNRQKVESAWDFREAPATNWWDIPDVCSRWNCLITKDKEIEYYQYIAAKYFGGQKHLIGLSLGCGTGHRELKWVEQKCFSTIHAFDISASRIKSAIQEARAKGYDKEIQYQVGDVYEMALPKAHYDAIFVEQSLHHFTPLKGVLQRISTSLKPEGYFIVNEFVGPTRFQWTKRQIEAINGLLALLPRKYRRLSTGDKYKTNIVLQSKLRMRLLDPSEAVESSNIMPYLHEIFEVLELKSYGGTILHMLFNGIGHNFISDELAVKRWLRICFEVEDLLLSEGEISHDFIVAVCKNRSSPGSAQSLIC